MTTKTSDMVRGLVAAVPDKGDRGRREHAVSTFLGTYANRDVDTRTSLLADDCSMEDPAGLVVGRNKEKCRKFFEVVIARDIKASFTINRMIGVSNQVVVDALMELQEGEATPCHLALIFRFEFDDQDLISKIVTYFDDACVADAPPT